MTVIQYALEWYSVDNPTVAVDITEAFNPRTNKTTEIKNNITQFTLKYNDLSQIEKGVLRFKEKDKFRIYLNIAVDAVDLADTSWRDANSLIGDFILEEYKFNQSSSSAVITVKAVDQLYILFNRVFSKEFGVSQNYTAPGIFRSVVRLNTNKDGGEFVGTDEDSGSYFDINAKFESEGGLIEDRRDSPTTLLSGSLTAGATTITVDSTSGFKDSGTLVIDTEHIAYTGTTSTTFTGCTRAIDDTSVSGAGESHNDNSTVYQGFPLITMAKTWKPVFTWLSELSQVDQVNYDDEVVSTGSYYYTRAFMLTLDENGAINYFAPTTSVDTALELGTDTIYNMLLDRLVFGSVNFVIYNCGKDMNGNGVTWYWYDQGTDTPDFKMRFQPMTDITTEFVKEDLKINSTRDTANTQDIYKQFPSSGSYPLSNWAFKSDSNRWREREGDSPRSTIADDSEYNDSLREACKWKGLIKAQDITSRLTGLRYKGTIVLRGTNIKAGDLITVTDDDAGISAQKLRVIGVTHSLTPTAWTTTLQVEEDAKEVI